MKVQERYIWIAALVLAGFFFQNQESRMNNLQSLIMTYSMETQIQDQQISDFSQQLHSAEQAEYSKGFENGKTQAGIALVQGGTLYNYADGYHAAISQISDDVGLEVSKGMLTELNNLRTMVPRLLNQVEEITEDNNQLSELVIDGLSREVEVEEVYLDILDVLTDDEKFTELSVD